MKTLLFYASVKDPSLFQTQKFYVNTVRVLRKIGFNVILTNKCRSALMERYDGLFCFFYRKSVIPAYIAKARGKKVFFTGGIDALERSQSSRKSYLIQLILFKLCRWVADSCLIESMADLRNANRVCLIKNHKNLVYCPQAIITKNYDCNLSDKEDIFTTICWQGTEENIKRKGVDKALTCFSKIVEDNFFRDCKFYIIGRQGAGTKYIQKIAQKLGIERYVVLTGEISEGEKISILKRSRYFFQLSSYEGFGLAALEAIASKCIPIHSGRGGLNDTLKCVGVKVDIDRIQDDQMGDIIEKLKSNLEKYVSDIEEIQIRIREEFDESVRIKNFEKTICKSFMIER